MNEQLRQARLCRAWTQAKLAEKLGVAESTVRAWEQGTRTPLLEMREHLCTLFGMTLEELGLQLEEPQTPDAPPLFENTGIQETSTLARLKQHVSKE